MTAVVQYTPTSDPYINGVLTGIKWATNWLTFSFPSSSAFYGSNYGTGQPYNGFQAFNALQQAAVRTILQGYAAVANVHFTEITETTTQHADVRFGETNSTNTAWTYYPWTNPEGGDAWFNNSSHFYDSPQIGNYAWFTIIHEIAHSMGLKDVFETNGPFGVMPANRDSVEYSVESYLSYIGAPNTGNYTISSGSYPQSLMMYDIAGLQFEYGANFTTNNGNTIYKWDANTGEEFINGVGQGAPGANKVFLTVWDGGGTDTYDFSNYSTNLTIDLNPGGWTTTSAAQLANLGNGHFAVGNIANAFLYQGNPASLIENAIGGSGNDTITGNSANNTLTGGDGNDHLDGVSGVDTMFGGRGNDTYVVENPNSVVNETGGDGTDTVLSWVNFSLADPVHAVGAIENLTLLGGGAINGTGNDLDNTIIGNIGSNVLTGGGGNDYLDGIWGVDTMFGGAGNDTYVVENPNSVVNETGGDGTDTVLSWVSFSLADPVHAVGAIENLKLIGSSSINATGNGLDNVITGNSGNNTLIGGAGADTLDGGGGSDTASYITSPSAVTVSLMTGVCSGGDAQGDTLVGIDNLVGSNFDDTLEGNTNNGVLNGCLGNDTVSFTDAASGIGGMGVSVNLLLTSWQNTITAGWHQLISFENITGSEFNDTLIGTTGDNTLTGGGGNDYLDGIWGVDTMFGGRGNDTYVVENPNSVVNETGGDGTDTVLSWVNFSLADPVHAVGAIENLTLLGGGAINGTGNDLDNTIIGNIGSNVLTGGGGNDYLDGIWGVDTMFGGAGNDTYVVENPNSVVNETGGDGTDTVLSWVSFSLADPVHAVGAIENLKLIGSSSINATGNGLDNVITGNSGNNTLIGGAGADTLDGGGGSDTASYITSPSAVTVSLMTGVCSGGDAQGDTLVGIDNLVGSNFDDTLEGNTNNGVLNGCLGNDTVSFTDAASGIGGMGVSVNLLLTSWQNTITAGWHQLISFENITGSEFNDTLIGTTGDNTLTGGGGNDYLDGIWGVDTMFGGRGNDTYVVENPNSVVNETGGDGTDTVLSWVNFSLADPVHAVGAIENLTLLGGGAINGTGNDLDNTIIGNIGSNVLTGGGGNDYLDGIWGVDTMFGGAGNDTYVVENPNSVVNETGGDGTDTVLSWVSFSLADPVHAVGAIENLKLIGSSSINATGNGLDNVITGNSGNNTLTGGGGDDTFVFAPGFGKDTITDFAAGPNPGPHDVIEFDHTIFADFAAVLAATAQVGSDTVITADPHDTLTLKNMVAVNLHADDFHFA